MRRIDRQITDKSILRAFLEESAVCHVGLIFEAHPYVVGLNFGFLWDTDAEFPVLYFHCAKTGQKIEAIRSNGDAAFFIDSGHELITGEKACDWGMKYRSVAGRGNLSFVSEPKEKKVGLDAIMRHYSKIENPHYDERVFAMTEVLRLDVASLSGKEKK